MATQNFGRRGAPPQAAVAAAAIPGMPPEPAAAARQRFDTAAENDPLGFIPLLTLGMMVFLLFVFGFQRRLAFDIGRDGSLSLESLLAAGAVSYDLVIGSGEVWRAALAPLLHSSWSHLIGNAFALFFVGKALEPLIGRGWFAAVFAASALGGVVGSLIGNPHGIPTVGASGAITGLIGALFAVSFSHRAEPQEQAAMRKTALFFGVPALLPLAFGAHGNTDYFAHAGGALAGAAVGFGLCIGWAGDSLRPALSRQAGWSALGGLAAAGFACVFAALHFQTYAAKAAQLIPAAQLPKDMLTADARTSTDLVSRYPKDPRAHIVRAIYLAGKGHNLSGADNALRTAMALADGEPAARPIRDMSQAILAGVLKDMGRRAEAKAMAAELCRSKERGGVKGALAEAKLCE